jgi:hypothetical protein
MRYENLAPRSSNHFRGEEASAGWASGFLLLAQAWLIAIRVCSVVRVGDADKISAGIEGAVGGGIELGGQVSIGRWGRYSL